MAEVKPATDEEIASLQKWCDTEAPKAESWQTIARLLARISALEERLAELEGLCQKTFQTCLDHYPLPNPLCQECNPGAGKKGGA